MNPRTRRSLIGLVAKLAALEIMLGGPLLVTNELRPVIGKWLILLVAIPPIVLFYMGASQFAESEDTPRRRMYLRLGVLGTLMIVPMNLYAIGRLLEGRLQGGGTTAFGVLLCSVVLVTYLVLATRELRKAPAHGMRLPDGSSDPIE